MSRLYKLNETASWLQATIGGYRKIRTALKHVRRAAEEQRANLESCRRDRRFPGSMREDEYRECVELLEQAIPELETRASMEEATDKYAEDVRRQTENIFWERYRAKLKGDK